MNTEATVGTTASIKVWDLFVRAGHWAIVVLFAAAYVTGDEGGWIHLWSGYAIAAIVVGRVIWGFVGPEHARFRDFVFGPVRVASYVGRLVSGRARRYVGHSPAGGTMAVLLLVMLAATTATGMAQYAQEAGRGPLAPLLAGSPAAVEREVGEHEEDEGEYGEHAGGVRGAEAEEGESAFAEVHEVLANATLALIALHVVGVLYAGRAHHENLVRAMFTGRKRPEPAGGGD
ncbi:MAG: cytochrome B [Alphaproteobacteria bacterium]|jgi:cytochrome b|nr:cytochrome B [Alphaproteobacteria bacterium]